MEPKICSVKPQQRIISDQNTRRKKKKERKRRKMKYLLITFLFIPWLKIMFVLLLSIISIIGRIKQVV